MCFFGIRNIPNAFGSPGEDYSKKLFSRNMFKKSDYEKEVAFTVASFAEVLNIDNSCSRLNSLW